MIKKMRLLLLLPILSATVLLSAEPVLVGQWKLDDKEGDVAADSSPNKNDAKAFNGPGRVAGKTGGAFSFDGAKQYVEIPNSKDLEKLQAGSYAIAAWFKADKAPPGTDDANDAQYAIVIKTGWHEGLSYSNDKKFMFTHWLKGDADPAWSGVAADTEYEPGEWHHLVGLVDKDAHVAKIYVDGELKGTSQEWDANAAAKDYEKITWKIGVGSPTADKWAWHAKGAISDVRLYASALTDDQVKALFEATSKPK